MIKFRYIALIGTVSLLLGAFLFSSPDRILGQNSSVSTMNPWKYVSGVISPRVDTAGIKIPSLASTNDCLVTDTSGNVTATACSSGSYPTYLSQVGDVSTTTLANGYVLKWSGTEWESVATSTLNITALGDGTFSTTSADYWAFNDLQLGQVSDVSTSSLSINHLLYWTGTEWSTIATSSLGITGAGTVTSVAQTVPTGLTISGSPVTTSGTLAIGYTAGYSIPLTASTTEGSTAYTWGNHAIAGYQTLAQVYSIVGATTTLPNLSITESQISNLDHYTDTDTNAYIHGSTTIPKTYTTNTFTGLQTFGNASTTYVSATRFWGDVIGTASLATALAGNGSNCSAGQFPLGVDASGAVETCTDAWTESENTSAGYLNTTGVNAYIHGSTTIPKTYTNNTFTGLQTFDNASTTNLSVTDITDLGVVRGVSLNEVEDLTADKAFTMGANNLTFNFTTPSDGLTLNVLGAFTDHVLHIHQSVGNPSAGTQLLHLHAEDTDVQGLLIETGASTTPAINVLSGTTNLVGGLVSMNNATSGMLTVTGNSWLNTIKSGTWNGTSIADSYIDDTITASNYVLTSAFNGLFDTRLGATTSLPQVTTLANLATVGTAGATTTVAGKLKATEAFTLGTDYITDLTGTGLVRSSNTLAVDQTSAFTWTGAHIFNTATTTFNGGIVLAGRTQQTLEKSFAISSSTAFVGTTTKSLSGAGDNQLWNWAECYTDAGTVDVYFTDGTNRMNWFQASTTVGRVTFTTNNSFTSKEKRYIEFGKPQSSPKELSCTTNLTVNK